MSDYASFILGVACAAIGGELFVRASVGLARWARVSPGIIGATVAAFATSSPELSVSVNAAIAGSPQIGLGDALGSNVLNVALILALALVISGIRCPRDSVRRDFPVALLVPLITGALMADGQLSRLDGLLMLGTFAAWLAAVIIEARKQRSAAAAVLGERRPWLAVLWCVVGLAFLIAAGRLIVVGATGIAVAFGFDQFVVGATAVAVGTSVPELATTIVAKLRGHDEISLGTILGSNIFNGLLIVPTVAVIRPAAVDWGEVGVALLAGAGAIALAYPTRAGYIKRTRGAMLLALYGVYLFGVLQR